MRGHPVKDRRMIRRSGSLDIHAIEAEKLLSNVSLPPNAKLSSFLTWRRLLTAAILFLLFITTIKSLPLLHGLLSTQSHALMSANYAGLNPEYKIRQEEIRSTNKEEQSYAYDFREIKFAPLSKPPGRLYQGHTCLSHYPGEVCPIPAQCLPPASDGPGVRAVQSKGPCIHWERGVLANPISVTPEDVRRGRSKESLTTTWDVDGVWDGEKWTPKLQSEFPFMAKSNSKYRSFSPQEMHKCLAGKRIFIQGDSMIRQVYNRLIHWSREIPVCTLLFRLYF